MGRGLSTALASVALVPAAAAAQQQSPAPQPPVPQGGRAVAVTATGDTAQPRAHHSEVTAAGAVSVSIKDFSFGPKLINVQGGGPVSLSNAGTSEHNGTAGSFDTGILKK